MILMVSMEIGVLAVRLNLKPHMILLGVPCSKTQVGGTLNSCCKIACSSFYLATVSKPAMDSIEHLECHESELKKRKRELTEELQRQKRRARKSSRKEEERIDLLLHDWGAEQETQGDACVPPQLHRHISALVLLLQLSGFCTDLVVSWALGQGSIKKRQGSSFAVWDAEARRAISSGIEWLYIFAPMHLILSAIENCNPEELYQLSRYVIEYNLFHWLIKQNCEIGAAPKSAQIFEEVFRLIKVHLANLLPEAVEEKLSQYFMESKRAARYWLVSFRKRWGIRPGQLDAGEELEPQQLQSRESWQFYSC